VNSIVISAILFVCTFGGSLLGMAIQSMLPAHHLSSESKDAIKQGIGLIGTMTALILGLLLASAKATYDNQRGEIAQMSSRVIYLDRLLAMYGPQSADARATLRRALVHGIDRIWPRETSQASDLDPMYARGDDLYPLLDKLAPENDSQRTIKSMAMNTTADLGLMRWELYGQMGSSVSMPFLLIVIFWLTAIFVSYGMFSPRNGTVKFTLVLCALSVSGAMFLILELDRPFDGLLRISSAPMRAAVEHLGK
jgi:hypothetical protein